MVCLSKTLVFAKISKLEKKKKILKKKLKKD